MSIEIKGKEDVDKMFEIAPEAFKRCIRSWLYAEKNLFVGGKKGKRPSAFQKELQTKQRKYKSGTWSKYVASAFGGEVNNEKNIDGMYLHMHQKEDRKNTLPFLEALGTGATITPKNAKWLIIPNYKNLLSVGLFGNYGGSGKNTFQKLFRKLYKTSQLSQPLPFHGKLLYFADTPDKSSSHEIRHMNMLNRSLLFVGVTKVRISKQFDFEKSWNTRLPAALKRGRSRIDKTLRAIERFKTDAA